jgi:hypothetical protein
MDRGSRRGGAQAVIGASSARHGGAPPRAGARSRGVGGSAATAGGRDIHGRLSLPLPGARVGEGTDASASRGGCEVGEVSGVESAG